MRCCPMAESHFTLGLEFLHIRGGCSLTFHTLTSVGRKSFSAWLKNVPAFSSCSDI